MSSSVIEADIQRRLAHYGRFGVHLGLDRIQRLLAALEHPQRRVPIIHVAGTNGKGSVCAYLSAMLAEAGYTVGRYTSPHLVSWCERICINDVAIAPTDLEKILTQVEAAVDAMAADNEELPTQFEILTAVAWLYFAQQQVDIAVIEVGLGGRLDATNVVDAPLVSVITSLSREHWQRLGPTLADIAGEKAGVLKASCPVVVGPLPPEAKAVVWARAQQLNCPMVEPPIAQVDAAGWAVYPASERVSEPLRYALPFAGSHQLVNSSLAIATLQTLRHQGWAISDAAMQAGIAHARWPGRLQWIQWTSGKALPQSWLIDGAHNPAAAQVLRQYVDDICRPSPSPAARRSLQRSALTPPLPDTVTWLMGMLATKDHADVFRALLRPGDRLHLVPVPDHAAMAPQALQAIALDTCPDLAVCHTHDTLAEGLEHAAADTSTLKVLCGSLYLIGHFLQTQAFSDRL